jgi:DNA-binding MurR/RpiR family transcriptional regulator
MSHSLFDRLARELDGYTAAERAVANFILSNRATLPFETAASVAEKLGVSAATVGRFCRLLGYQHFKALKEDLKTDIAGAPWLVGEQFDAFVSHTDDDGALKRSLEREISALVEVYSLAATPMWREVVRLLAHTELVFVTGFQTERGMAAMFAHEMQYMREGVFEADAAGAHYAEVFATERQRCLVVFESRRYSRQAFRLCERAHQEGVPLILITDKYCDWGRRFTPHVITVQSETGLFWDSSVAAACVVTLLTNAIVAELGPGITPRLARFSALYQDFVGHVGIGDKGRGGN